jgi:hypothetical protein
MSILSAKARELDGGLFDLRAAVAMAAAIDHMVRIGRIDARSPAADARLCLGDGEVYSREETDAILSEVLPAFAGRGATHDPAPRQDQGR